MKNNLKSGMRTGKCSPARIVPSRLYGVAERGVYAASTSELKDAFGFSAKLRKSATLKRAKVRAPGTGHHAMSDLARHRLDEDGQNHVKNAHFPSGTHRNQARKYSNAIFPLKRLPVKTNQNQLPPWEAKKLGRFSASRGRSYPTFNPSKMAGIPVNVAKCSL